MLYCINPQPTVSSASVAIFVVTNRGGGNPPPRAGGRKKSFCKLKEEIALVKVLKKIKNIVSCLKISVPFLEEDRIIVLFWFSLNFLTR